MTSCVIIDDEVHCLETMQLLLKEYCPEIHVAASVRSGKQGIEAIEKHKPNLLFLDIEMPMMNGFEMLEQLKENIVRDNIYNQL